MKFALDVDGRFVLTAREGGWELVVDGDLVHYCRDPLAALRYMSEELREGIDVQGVGEVVAALDRIDKTMSLAAEVVSLERASVELKRVLAARLSPSGSRREHVKHTSLRLAGLGPGESYEFGVRPDARNIVVRAKAILEPWLDT